MKIKIGDVIEHGGEKFVVTDIQHNEYFGKMSIIIRGFDPDTTNELHTQSIKMFQVSQGVVDMLKKILDENKKDDFEIGGT